MNHEGHEGTKNGPHRGPIVVNRSSGSLAHCQTDSSQVTITPCSYRFFFVSFVVNAVVLSLNILGGK